MKLFNTKLGSPFLAVGALLLPGASSLASGHAGAPFHMVTAALLNIGRERAPLAARTYGHRRPRAHATDFP